MTKTMRCFSVSVIVLLLAAATAPLLSGQSAGDQGQLLSKKFKMTRSDLNKGEEQLKKKQYDQAEATLLKVLKEMPENAQASFFLAETYYEKGESEKGLAAIVEAEKNFPLIQKFLSKKQKVPVDERTKDRALMENQINADQQISPGEPVLRGLGHPEVNPRLDEATKDRPGVQEVVSKVESLPAEYSYVHGNLLFLQKKKRRSVCPLQEGAPRRP